MFQDDTRRTVAESFDGRVTISMVHTYKEK